MTVTPKRRPSEGRLVKDNLESTTTFKNEAPCRGRGGHANARGPGPGAWDGALPETQYRIGDDAVVARPPDGGRRRPADAAEVLLTYFYHHFDEDIRSWPCAGLRL